MSVGGSEVKEMRMTDELIHKPQIYPLKKKIKSVNPKFKQKSYPLTLNHQAIGPLNPAPTSTLSPKQNKCQNFKPYAQAADPANPRTPNHSIPNSKSLKPITLQPKALNPPYFLFLLTHIPDYWIPTSTPILNLELQNQS